MAARRVRRGTRGGKALAAAAVVSAVSAVVALSELQAVRSMVGPSELRDGARVHRTAAWGSVAYGVPAWPVASVGGAVAFASAVAWGRRLHPTPRIDREPETM